MIKHIQKNTIWFYILKFSLAYGILYYGTLAIIGLSVKGGLYSQFVHDYLDYISVLRSSILKSANYVCHFLNYDTTIEGTYILRIRSGIGVRMVYKCIGYGIMSFWGAFIIANTGAYKKKILWILLGWILIYIINVCRVSFLLISVATKRILPFNIDHHTLFNTFAYILVLIMIYFYDKSLKIKKIELI